MKSANFGLVSGVFRERLGDMYLCRRSWYVGHVYKKCSSSSIDFEVHVLHILSHLFKPICLPLSIMRSWLEVINLVMLFLCLNGSLSKYGLLLKVGLMSLYSESFFSTFLSEIRLFQYFEKFPFKFFFANVGNSNALKDLVFNCCDAFNIWIVWHHCVFKLTFSMKALFTKVWLSILLIRSQNLSMAM